jgi:predicted kinase
MVGIPGSGKSFFAEHFSNTFKSPIISLSRIQEKLGGDIDAKSIDDISNYLLDEMLKTGQTIVYDGNTNMNIDRQKIAKKAKANGYEPLFIWTQTDMATSKKRSKKSLASPDVFDAILKKFSPPNKTENTVVISGKHTYSSQLKIVLKRLAGPQAQKTNDDTEIVRTSNNRRVLIR